MRVTNRARVRVRVGSEGAGHGFGVGGQLRLSLAPGRQAVPRTEGSRRAFWLALRSLRRRDPDEMVSISPS